MKATRLATALATIPALLLLTAAALYPATALGQLTCAPGFVAAGNACTVKLGYTGKPVTVSVPGGVQLQMEAAGGSGNLPGYYAYVCPGQGYAGAVSGDLEVDKPESLTVEVGGIGGPPTGTATDQFGDIISTYITGGVGGYGGGGAGGNGGEVSDLYYQGGGGGGGGTFIFGPSGPLLIGAGGGGGGGWSNAVNTGSESGGGCGGVALFGAGAPTAGCVICAGTSVSVGQPASATAGGAGGGDGTPGGGTGNAVGQFGTGGAGGSDAYGGGGGGGGGLYGGGGGGGSATSSGVGGGGGGAYGFIGPSLTNPYQTTTALSDDGFAQLTYTSLCPESTAKDPAERRSDRSARAIGPCDLDVVVEMSKRFHAGLSRDGIADAAFIDQGSEKCQSGCAEVTATVTDSKGKRVSGAEISASVTGITASVPAYPKGGSSPGFLCDAAQPTHCGSGGEITDLKTNGNGQVSLLYWAPGVTSRQSATVTVDASACTTSCRSGSESGQGNAAVTVAPNAIYSAHFNLSADEAKALAEWSQSKTLGEVLKDHAIELLIATAVGKAAEELIEEEKAAEAIHEIADNGLKARSFYTSSNLEEQFMWLFLAGLKLSPTGLGDPPDEQSVSAVPGDPFEKAFVGAGNLLQLGNGLLWKLGVAEHATEEEGKLGPQVVHLTAYEVSYCEQGKECGPGYHDRNGIRPYLDLELTSSTHDDVVFPFTQAVTPYNARAWMTTQFRN